MAAPQEHNTKGRGTMDKPDLGISSLEDMVQALLDSVNNTLREKYSILEDADESGPMSTTKASTPQETPTPRIEPHTSPKLREKNPVKQAAGHLGAEAKAKKRNYNSTEMTDERKPRAKKREKVGYTKAKNEVSTSSPHSNHTNYIYREVGSYQVFSLSHRYR